MPAQYLDSLSDFDRGTFTADGVSHEVFRKGSGPCVIVIHELPGLTPLVADFARSLVAVGLSVTCPVLVGTPGRPFTQRYVLQSLAKVCISKEFSIFTGGQASPIVDWLRALSRHEHERCGGPGVGVVGMCFSGGFALAVATEPSVIAPVMSQPSSPAVLPWKKTNGSAVDASSAELAVIKERMHADEELCVLGYRFSHDPLVPSTRFERLTAELGDRFIGVTFDSSPSNPDGRTQEAHSVMTSDRVPVAIDEVTAFMRRRLLSFS